MTPEQTTRFLALDRRVTPMLNCYEQYVRHLTQAEECRTELVLFFVELLHCKEEELWSRQRQVSYLVGSPYGVEMDDETVVEILETYRTSGGTAN